MSSKALRYAAVLAAAALILFAAYWTAAQIRAKAAAARGKSGQLGTTLVRGEQFDGKFQDELEAALKAQQAPPARLAAFRQFDTPEFRLHGWIAQPIEVDAGRSLVKLRVSPMITSIHGAPTTVPAAHEETYRFQDGELVLVDAAIAGRKADPAD
jgi:hypothetical protein